MGDDRTGLTTMVEDTTRHLTAIRERFGRLHAEGMIALEAQDFETLGRVMKQEREMIDEQALLLRGLQVLRARVDEKERSGPDTP